MLGPWLQRGAGSLMVALGVLHALSHVIGKPRPMKLGAMMRRYGSVGGRAVHLFAYTLVPIAFGALLLIRS